MGETENDRIVAIVRSTRLFIMVLLLYHAGCVSDHGALAELAGYEEHGAHNKRHAFHAQKIYGMRPFFKGRVSKDGMDISKDFGHKISFKFYLSNSKFRVTSSYRT
jgi:hypothetical protein